LMTVEYVKSLIKLYPKEIHWSFDGTKSKGSKTNDNSRSKVWITSVGITELSKEVKKIDKVASKVASSQISNTKNYKLSTLYWSNKPPFKKSDLVVCRWTKGRGFEFECPERVIDIIQVQNTKEYIIYSEQQKRVRNISSTQIKNSYSGSTSNILFKNDGTKKLISSKNTKDFLQLWSQFRL